jgi:hypothetical protein
VSRLASDANFSFLKAVGHERPRRVYFVEKLLNVSAERQSTNWTQCTSSLPEWPIVPMSVRAPVAASMLYVETLFEPELVT